MNKFTVSGTPLMLGSGEIAVLSAEQLASRRHNVEVLDANKDGSAKVTVINPLTFKEGEELILDRLPKTASAEMRSKAKAEGKTERAPTKKALKQAFDEGFAEGRADGVKALAEELTKTKQQARADLLAEIEQRNALFEGLENVLAAQESLGSDASDADKAEAQKAVDDAQAAVDALKPLEA